MIATCVDGWLSLIAAAGDLWSVSTGSFGFGDNDLDRLLVDARDDLVQRMIDELPFQAGLDRDLLAAALRSYAALARVAGQEWLRAGTINRAQAAALLLRHRQPLQYQDNGAPGGANVDRLIGGVQYQHRGLHDQAFARLGWLLRQLAVMALVSSVSIMHGPVFLLLKWQPL